MANIVGIRFKRVGRVYYFTPGELELEVNDRVVVKTARGLELGQVVIAPKEVLDGKVSEPLKLVVRRASEEDIEQAEKLKAQEEEALTETGELVTKLNLPMKLLSAEYNIDGSRLTLCFSAEGRVDFRELVRELNKRFKAKVELRQVGPRDEAKLIGGFGRCGRPLCCASFLSEFEPISIKMAKEQDLPLNPLKISGVCGRLLCCLSYESELYRALKADLPEIGQKVTTPMGTASVVGVNPLKETVLVELESETTVELPSRDVSPISG
jgi:cell fate regulator YaaT (PSP1 superfamily)